MSHSNGPSGSGSSKRDGHVEGFAEQLAGTPLSGGNAGYVEDLYERHLAGEEIPADWKRYFAALAPRGGERAHGPILREIAERAALPVRAVVAGGEDPALTEKQAAVSRLIQIYTNRGHLVAKLDPLGLLQRPKPRVQFMTW